MPHGEYTTEDHAQMEVVAALEALTKAVRGQRISTVVKAPDVKVSVDSPSISIPVPQVIIKDEACDYDFTFQRDGHGRLSGATARVIRA